MPRRFVRSLIAMACATATVPVLAQTPAPQTPAVPIQAASQSQAPIPGPAPASRTVTFDEAVTTALEKHPNVARAAQAILRAEALLQSARSVFQPGVNGSVTTTILRQEGVFQGQVTQPQTQTNFAVQAAYPILAASRWAQAAQASDQVGIAKIGAQETRRQVALAVSQAYLAIIAAHRQVTVNQRALENGRAHLSYATARLQAGAGSRLNELRAAQESSTDEVLLEASLLALRRAQEALGELLVADAAVDAVQEPAFEVPATVADGWLGTRTDIKLADAQISAADRVSRDSWKDWVPTGSAAFTPQYLTPVGLFQTSKTWSAVVQFSIPVFDGGVRRANAKLRDVSLDLTRIERTDLERQIRADERVARASVESTARALEAARRAADQADEVVRITDVAFRAGATTNLEVIDAQRRARDAETAAAIAEDRSRQARLDLLVALGLFPR